MAATALPLWGCAAVRNPDRRDQTTRAWSEALASIERTAQGRLGVAMLDTGSGLALGWRQDERFAMASTFKLVLAGWMLALVDQGKERLDARVHYAAADVVAYSPVSGPRAGDGGGLTVGELCSATVSLSDNTAANVLLARYGGPAGFTAFVRSLGDPITRLDRTEPTLTEAAVGDPRDTTTPLAMLQTLQKLVLGNALSPRPGPGCRAGWRRPARATNGCVPVCRSGRWATRRAPQAKAVRPTTLACCGRRTAARQCW